MQKRLADAAIGAGLFGAYVLSARTGLMVSSRSSRMRPSTRGMAGLSRWEPSGTVTTRQMNGELTIASTQGKGTTASAALPAA
jgi:hypothetical protein